MKENNAMQMKGKQLLSIYTCLMKKKYTIKKDVQ